MPSGDDRHLPHRARASEGVEESPATFTPTGSSRAALDVRIFSARYLGV